MRPRSVATGLSLDHHIGHVLDHDDKNSGVTLVLQAGVGRGERTARQELFRGVRTGQGGHCHVRGCQMLSVF